MKKRGQAAMEFLMTYGWAILVVLVVIGALAYFGVLNPQQFLPKKCQFGTGLVCEDHILRVATDPATGISSGSGQFRVNNGLGHDIQVTQFTVKSAGVFECDTGVITQTLVAGASANIDLTGMCPTVNAQSGNRIKADLTLSYTDLNTGFSHQVKGTLLTDIE